MNEYRPEHGNAISKKKLFYPIKPALLKYLHKYSRNIAEPLQYEDLKRHNFSTPCLDKAGNDTLWETVYYSEPDRREIYPALTTIYAILKADGDTSIMSHLDVDRVDYCSFGNSNPFRIKIINRFNDNYDYFYVKTADASRVYGLELEHILSPNRIGYIICENTLIEEHIAGIPGDQFLRENLHLDRIINQTRIAKEFVKFNERCFVKLLGDMRAYNFVIDVTPDFDDIQYRIRAIDFDQQCYEHRKNMYLPQFFKENLPYVKLCIDHMTPETVLQYQREERALISNRIRTSGIRLKALMDVMEKDTISTPEKVRILKRELAEHYGEKTFLSCRSMGEIVWQSLMVAQKRDTATASYQP